MQAMNELTPVFAWTRCIRPTLSNTSPIQAQRKCQIGQSRGSESVGEFTHQDMYTVNMTGEGLTAIPLLTFLHDQNAFACLEFPLDTSLQYEQILIDIAQTFNLMLDQVLLWLFRLV